jgi:hypothetical protein
MDRRLAEVIRECLKPGLKDFTKAAARIRKAGREAGFRGNSIDAELIEMIWKVQRERRMVQ